MKQKGINRREREKRLKQETSSEVIGHEEGSRGRRSKGGNYYERNHIHYKNWWRKDCKKRNKTKDKIREGDNDTQTGRRGKETKTGRITFLMKKSRERHLNSNRRKKLPLDWLLIRCLSLRPSTSITSSMHYPSPSSSLLLYHQKVVVKWLGGKWWGLRGFKWFKGWWWCGVKFKWGWRGWWWGEVCRLWWAGW